MKKLCRKGQVHPSPSPPPSSSSSSSSSSSPSFDEFSLSYLPAAIFTLAAALSSHDKQVLAYLLSCSSTTPFHFNPSKTHFNNQNQPHPPSFSCYCFTCYTHFWALWDSSPNRQLIHEIIDAFEDHLVSQNKNKNQGLSRREKRKNKINNNKGVSRLEDISNNQSDYGKVDDENIDGSNGSVRVSPELGRVDSVEEVSDGAGEKQGSHVRKIVSFIGERIWGSVWG